MLPETDKFTLHETRAVSLGTCDRQFLIHPATGSEHRVELGEIPDAISELEFDNGAGGEYADLVKGQECGSYVWMNRNSRERTFVQ